MTASTNSAFPTRIFTSPELWNRNTQLRREPVPRVAELKPYRTRKRTTDSYKPRRPRGEAWVVGPVASKSPRPLYFGYRYRLMRNGVSPAIARVIFRFGPSGRS